MTNDDANLPTAFDDIPTVPAKNGYPCAWGGKTPTSGYFIGLPNQDAQGSLQPDVTLVHIPTCDECSHKRYFARNRRYEAGELNVGLDIIEELTTDNGSFPAYAFILGDGPETEDLVKGPKLNADELRRGLEAHKRLNHLRMIAAVRPG